MFKGFIIDYYCFVFFVNVWLMFLFFYPVVLIKKKAAAARIERHDFNQTLPILLALVP